MRCGKRSRYHVTTRHNTAASGTNGDGGGGAAAAVEVRRHVCVCEACRCLQPHVIPAAIQTSRITRHTSHVTNHTSHITRHTSHVTCHAAHLSTFDIQVEAGLHCSASMAAFTSRDSATLWLTCISCAWGEDRGSSWASKHLQARALVQRAARLRVHV